MPAQLQSYEPSPYLSLMECRKIKLLQNFYKWLRLLSLQRLKCLLISYSSKQKLNSDFPLGHVAVVYPQKTCCYKSEALRCILLHKISNFFSTKNHSKYSAREKIVNINAKSTLAQIWDTALQAGSSWVPFPLRSSGLLIDFIIPAAL